MKEVWDKTDQPRVSKGTPVARKWSFTDPLRKPKGLSYSPSLRAIRNYNDLPIDNDDNPKEPTDQGLDNPAFESEYKYEYYVDPRYNSISKIPDYDYPSLSTRSMKTSHSGGSDVLSIHSNHAEEMGSSVKLVTEKVERSCKTWCIHVSTIMCTISMAAGLGNLYRLPQTTVVRGGLPFLVAYAILSVIIGLPLLFLELGIGQMAEEGFIKSWRAVPFFKGIGYVKLLAGCLLSIYYPLYIGMALMYFIWIQKGPVPFTECASGVIITENGYVTASKNGQDCLSDTFIKSPLDDPYYFGIYTALLLFIWIIVVFLSIRRTKSYIRALLILLFPTMACYVALTTKSILFEAEMTVLYKFSENVDWGVLKTAEVWYYAAIQVFFSTNVGFGSFITNAGIIYNKVNPFWTALGYIVTNLVFGTGSIIVTSILTTSQNVTSTSEVAEVKLFALIYDAMVSQGSDDFRYWMIATYLLFVFSGFISMATLSYTLLKAIYGHDGIRLKWWQTSVVFSFTGFVMSCLLLLKKDFDLVHLLDHYIVGNLIMICVIAEVVAFVAFYGTNRIQSDFEFMLGHILSKIWLGLWWFIPFLLTGLFIWALSTMQLNGIYRVDPVWLYALGWSVLLIAIIFIIATGIFITRQHDGYTIIDKLKASLEPSHNWGPKDPMLRYNWVQWNSKSQSGERDFTLKRRGTKEYTRTIRKKAKKEASELSANSIPGAYFKNDMNVTINNNTIPNGVPLNGGNDHSSENGHSRLSDGSHVNYSLYFVSGDGKRNVENGDPSKYNRESPMIDSLEHEIVPVTKRHHHHHHHHHHRKSKNNRNIFPNERDRDEPSQPIRHSVPLNQTKYATDVANDENSEGYGTFRNKGPYIIDGDIGHVCHKKFVSEHEAVTVL
ncbi:sodium- and chloride-dependent neutral and basic amino acid transporter B(0+)-like isoform X2 [Anthonomus grandis grandis]|uniref:sodium- and chloride-dependent neutral and basic amino acid transporter B(0+)-like isoform X2 n=1 Tax=Anthonomus grandis grandis TaxID=2921223 RepID=UPI00216542FD|nr:sodium- and chloride-dependent neutral and basic amino acid transporter B(0+)-like isoform X2 [Anthonomus grandis grandis]